MFLVLNIAAWILILVLSWAAYSGYTNLKDSKQFVDDVYVEPKENIPSSYLLAIRNMTENYPFLKEYTKEIGGIIVFRDRSSFMSIGGSIAQILCIGMLIFSIVEFYPIKLICSIIFFFIFGYIGSRFNRKAMVKKMSKVFALKLEGTKDLETRNKYYSILEQYHNILDVELTKYKEHMVEANFIRGCHLSQSLQGSDDKKQQPKEPEIKEAFELLDAASDKFGSEFDLVREQIKKTLNSDTKQFLDIVQKGRTVRKYIYSTIANISGDMVESGQYHIYRGALMRQGEGLLNIFDAAMDELVELGDTDTENAEKQKKAIRENIKNIG